MGNFATVLPYTMLILAILMLLLNAFIFSKIPSKLWANWYHESIILQPIATTLLFIGFLCFTIFYWTFRHNDTFAFIIVSVGFAFALMSIFFSIRAIVLHMKAKENSKKV